MPEWAALRVDYPGNIEPGRIVGRYTILQWCFGKLLCRRGPRFDLATREVATGPNDEKADRGRDAE